MTNTNARLQRITAICADLMPLASLMTDEQLHQRAQVIHAALRARHRMQALRDRAAALNDALVRFKSRRAEIARRSAA